MGEGRGWGDKGSGRQYAEWVGLGGGEKGLTEQKRRVQMENVGIGRIKCIACAKVCNNKYEQM